VHDQKRAHVRSREGPEQNKSANGLPGNRLSNTHHSIYLFSVQAPITNFPNMRNLPIGP